MYTPTLLYVSRGNTRVFSCKEDPNLDSPYFTNDDDFLHKLNSYKYDRLLIDSLLNYHFYARGHVYLTYIEEQKIKDLHDYVDSANKFGDDGSINLMDYKFPDQKMIIRAVTSSYRKSRGYPAEIGTGPDDRSMPTTVLIPGVCHEAMFLHDSNNLTWFQNNSMHIAYKDDLIINHRYAKVFNKCARIALHHGSPNSSQGCLVIYDKNFLKNLTLIDNELISLIIL